MKSSYIKNVLIVTLIFFSAFSFAQKAKLVSPHKYYPDIAECPHPIAEESSFLKITRSQYVKDKMENKQAPCSNFEITFVGTNFQNNPEARAAFQFAADIWSNLLDSPVPIRVNATFEDADANNLGSAGSDGFFLLSGGDIPPNTLFPAALTEQLLGEDVDGPAGTSNDINANFNGARTDWYFGIDPNGIGPNEFDFITVVLHELGHGLGVLGFGGINPGSNDTEGRIRRLANGETVPRLVSIWDNFIDGTDILDRPVPILDTSAPFGFPDPSAIMLNEFQGGTLTINSPIAVAQNGGVPPRTFAPATFNPGSSYSHLDEATFNNTPNALMTPNAARNEIVRDPGPII